MKLRPLLPLLPLLFGLAACGAEPTSAPDARAEAPSNPGEFGQFTEHEALPVADVLADPAAFAGREAVLEGELLAVCSASGCWFELGASGQSVMVVLEDAAGQTYGIPTDSAGRAQASGELELDAGAPRLVARGVRLLEPWARSARGAAALSPRASPGGARGFRRG